MNGSLHCGDSEPSAVPFYWRSSDYWSWCHAMVIHSEMALWQLWSSFDSSNCSPSRVKMGLSLALSNNKKHLVGILMNKKHQGKMQPVPRHVFDKLAVCHFDYLNSPLRSYEIWGKLSSDIPLAATGDVTVVYLSSNDFSPSCQYDLIQTLSPKCVSSWAQFEL